MVDGAVYVVNSQDSLYLLNGVNCVEGDSITLQNEIVTRFRLVNGKFVASDIVTLSNYLPTTYVCHVWDGKSNFNANYLILPAVLIMLCFFSVIFHWFLRLRG